MEREMHPGWAPRGIISILWNSHQRVAGFVVFSVIKESSFIFLELFILAQLSHPGCREGISSFLQWLSHDKNEIPFLQCCKLQSASPHVSCCPSEIWIFLFLATIIFSKQGRELSGLRCFILPSPGATVLLNFNGNAQFQLPRTGLRDVCSCFIFHPFILVPPETKCIQLLSSEVSADGGTMIIFLQAGLAADRKNGN